MRLRDGAGRRLAEVPRPLLPHPRGGVQARSILGGDERGALARDAAQHRVDQALQRAAARLPHGAIHRGVGGRVQEQQLHGAEPQDVALGRRQTVGLLDALGEGIVDLAQAAQRRQHQQAREGAVASFQRCAAAALGEAKGGIDGLAGEAGEQGGKSGAPGIHDQSSQSTTASPGTHRASDPPSQQLPTRAASYRDQSRCYPHCRDT